MGCDTDKFGKRGNVCSVRGMTMSKVVFGAKTIPALFTICSVSRYNGGARRRILDSEGNWLHGHWEGQIGVAYYEGWKTNHWTQIPTPPTDWLVFCGQNSSPSTFLANGVSVGNGVGGGSGSRTFGINSVGAGSSEMSDWAVAEVSTWNRALYKEEMAAFISIYSCPVP